ncbi:MAG: DUF2147 domain-containing protein [Bacteroidota bacterium]
MRFSFRALLLAALAFGVSLPALAQSPVGRWYTIDDEDGRKKSIVEVYEADGKLNGRIITLIGEEGNTDQLCIDCAEGFDGLELDGVVILTGMSDDDGDGEYTGGRITDPKSGKRYKAKMELNDDGHLEVRGYLGISLLGRTQVWEPAAPDATE